MIEVDVQCCSEEESLLNKIECLYDTKKCEEKARKRKRIIQILVFSVILFIIVIILGTIGYMFLFNLSFLDAFYHATLIITAISIDIDVVTVGQKLFIIVYALVSVIILLSIANSLIQNLFDIFVKE